MAPRPKLEVKVGSKAIGSIFKDDAGWHFRPSESTSLTQRIGARATLKRLAEDIKRETGVNEIKFHEVIRATQPAPKKRSGGHKSRPRKKLTPEEFREWLALERQQARFSPGAVSIESRDGRTSGHGRPVSGGLPGLGKRR